MEKQAKMITASINLSKIDKSKIIDGKDGAKYVNLTMWLNEDADQYGNHLSIQQSQSKEEREANQPKIYLGNGKDWSRNEPSTQEQESSQPTADDLPF